MEKKFKRHLITAALPYANGSVHIGHLAGVYVPADIYARFQRLKGEDVLFVCGSDEHGVPITIKAKQQGCTPQDIVDKYHAIIKDSFNRFGISFSIYSRTSSKIHAETASEFFLKLYKDGAFVEQESEQYFDTATNTFLADRYIVGTCPKCGFEGAYGDQCEKCGSTLSPDELINPHSSISGATPIKKKTKHWYLPLDKYEDWLKDWILNNHKEWKTNVYGQCKSWLDGGLKPRAVTRDLDWGIPVPLDDAKGKVLYVWFDAPIGYISNTKELLPNEWEKWWKSEDTHMVHFIGKDNIVFHCIVFPAMLKAHGGYVLPDNVPANEFLNLEGDKISTSRNWAVWLEDYLADFPGQQDVLRYALCANAPETKDNDFTWKDFQARNNSELVAIYGNFVNRSIVLTHKYFDGKVPAIPEGALQQIDKDFIAAIPQIKEQLQNSLENFKFRDALKEAMNMARLGNKYLTDTEPWKVIKTDKDRVAVILNLSLQLCANLSIAFEPFCPFSSKKLQAMLNIAPANKEICPISKPSGLIDWANIGRTDLLEAGHVINAPELLFSKIEDDAVNAQVQKLNDTKKANAAKAAEAAAKVVAPQKAECVIDDFDKMDIRTATVLEAVKVPKTDKLLKLTIDTGIDKRVIVSGIAEYYTPEQMVGKQICILANLKPRMLRGIESKGMILMAKDGAGKMRFVTPQEVVANGAQIG
ncbi:MAG: methionine--tRNA ligase [Bacteroidales bacterium]|jgi:methionyl-tRNA synthetase|nr:methionine--tRNA ligase [Bacteroidales bacterium]MCI1733140.1 methionine--tRNA ligase [Bacteroidales bacterium]